MATRDPDLTLQASLLDRLTDPESDGTGSRPGCTLEQMIDSVRRDLEDLLNTHRTLIAIPGGYTETENSILTFGLPDFSSFHSSKQDVSGKVAERIEQAIARHEPRLRNVRATLIEEPDEKQMKLKFQIHAILRVDPAPEVAFVTILKLSTGETSIQRVDT
jgi:type VI secretion system protein ImpF